jgi:Fe-S-cluster containining protein
MIECWPQIDPIAREYFTEKTFYWLDIFKPLSPADRYRIFSDKLRMMVADWNQSRNAKQASCRRGCSHCCWIPVSIFEHEAATLAAKMKSGEVDYNREEFERQKLLTAQELCAKPSPCIFLKDGECGVYRDRPATCKKYFVRSPPSLCKVAPGLNQRVAMILDYDMEAIYSAYANYETIQDDDFKLMATAIARQMRE